MHSERAHSALQTSKVPAARNQASRAQLLPDGRNSRQPSVAVAVTPKRRLAGPAALVASAATGGTLVLGGQCRHARALLHRLRRPCRGVRKAELGELDL